MENSKFQVPESNEKLHSRRGPSVLGFGIWDLELLFQLRQRFRAVAQLVFNFFTEFRKGLLITIGDKKRIVAEASLPARSQLHPAFARAVEDFGLHFQFVREANR